MKHVELFMPGTSGYEENDDYINISLYICGVIPNLQLCTFQDSVCQAYVIPREQKQYPTRTYRELVRGYKKEK